MEQHYTIQVRAHNEPGVLPRILLAFSRRRLRLQAVQFFDLDPARAADMQFDLDCAADHARDVVAQLRAIVEVTQVRVEAMPLPANETGPVPAAAAAA